MINKKNMISSISRSVNEAVNRDNIELNAKILANLQSKSADDMPYPGVLDKLGIKVIEYAFFNEEHTHRLIGPNNRMVEYRRRDSADIIVGWGPNSSEWQVTDPEQFDKIDFVSALTKVDLADHRHYTGQWGNKRELHDGTAVYRGDLLATHNNERKRYVKPYSGTNTPLGKLDRRDIVQKVSQRTGLQVNPGRTPRVTKAWWKNDK